MRKFCFETPSRSSWASARSLCSDCFWSARAAPVSKNSLFDAAWPGLAVEDSNLTVQIAALRRVFGEAGGADWIETLPRRGYRYVGPAVATACSHAAAPPTDSAAGPARTSRLSRCFRSPI